MKNNLMKISTVSMVCALMTSGAFAAASVRNLGGTGTYSGTGAATAAASKTSGTTASGSTAAGTARASALRVNSSANKSGTSTNLNTNNAGTRAASTSRVSLGQYLSGTKTAATGGGSSARPGTSNSSGPATSDLELRVGALEERAKNFVTEEELGDYALKSDIPEIPEIPDVVSAFENDAGYITDVELEEYDFATKDDVQQALEQADVATSEDMADLEGKLEAAKRIVESLQTTMQEELEKKADKDEVYTQSQVDEKLKQVSDAAGDLSAPSGVSDGYFWLHLKGGKVEWEKIDVVDTGGTPLNLEGGIVVGVTRN